MISLEGHYVNNDLKRRLVHDQRSVMQSPPRIGEPHLPIQ